MGAKDHLGALLWKNWLLWKRSLFTSLCEIIFPILMFLAVWGLRASVSPEDIDNESYAVPNNLDREVGQLVVPPVGNDLFALMDTTFDQLYNSRVDVEYDPNSMDYQLRKPTNLKGAFMMPYVEYRSAVFEYGWNLAFVPKSSTSDINTYLEDMIPRYYKAQEWIENEGNQNFGNFNADQSDVKIGIKQFSDEGDLEDEIDDDDYDDDDDQSNKIVFAIVMDNEPSASDSAIKLDFTLRYNNSVVGDEDGVFPDEFPIFMTDTIDATDEWQRDTNTDYQKDFYNSGFVQTQSLVYNYILREHTGNPNAYIAVAFTPMHSLDHKKDGFLDGGTGLLGFFIFISYITAVIKLINRLGTDKETKIRESMQMMGLKDTSYWLSWSIAYVSIYLVIAIFGTLIMAENIFPMTNGGLVFVILFLYGLSCMTFSMLIASIFQTAKSGILVGVLIYFVTYFSLAGTDETTSWDTKAGLSIFNNCAMDLTLAALFGFELAEQELNADNANVQINNYNVQYGITMLFVDMVVYLLISLYLDKVMPKEFGRSEKWYFLFTKSFWCGEEAHDEDVAEKVKEFTKEGSNKTNVALAMKNSVEEADTELKQQHETGQAMIVRNLTKQFGGNRAVDGIDFEMYEGQVFALLGHNGAGKTTTISMLTGLLIPTEGEMLVHGFDFKSQLDEIRKSLGVCPQHNVLWPDLTPQEHLELFCKFKGMTNKEEIKTSIHDKLEELQLLAKKDSLSKNLSGGQKRKLSLAIALIGGSKIIMLDEPTAGMDLTARRNTWDMLKNNKDGRIIILTTHYMEEADILADRIAIMSKGRFRCLGSSMFLKNRYGVGYTLTITKKVNTASADNSNKVTALVKESVPDAVTLGDVAAEISFRLPQNANTVFKSLFASLDGRLSDLQLENYSISVTTLEEVFLRVSRGDDQIEGRRASVQGKETEGQVPTPDEPSIQDNPELNESKQGVLIGKNDNAADKDFHISEDRDTEYQFFKNFAALFVKRMIWSKRDFKGIIFEILLPILLVVLGLIMLTQLNFFEEMGSYSEEIDQYDTKQDTIYNRYIPSESAGASQISTQSLMDLFEKQNSGDVKLNPMSDSNPSYATIDDLLYDERDEDPYRMGSYYFYKHDNINHQYEVVIFHNTTGFQSVPTYFNALAEAITAYATGKDTSYKLYNHPLPHTQKQKLLGEDAGSFFSAMIFSVGMAFIPTGIITFIVREREDNVKHQHLISGVSIPAYWLSSYAWDVVKHLIPAIVCALMILAFNITSMSAQTDNVYATTWLLFLFFGFAVAPFTYCTSFMFRSYASAQMVTFIFSIFIGAICGPMAWFMRVISEETRDAIDGLQWPLRLFPMFCFGFGLNNMINREFYKVIYSEDSVRDALDIEIAGGDVMMLVIDMFLYLGLVFFLERYSMAQLFKKCFGAKDPGMNEYEPDEDVEREKDWALSVDPNDVAVACKKLRQIYGNKLGGEQHVAVQDVSFTVKKNECFAMLGTNGAGKTSVFKILTSELFPTSGDSHIGGFSSVFNQSKTRQLIGYCPQFDAISALLTGKEHLELYARIKGVPKDKISDFVDQKLKEMDLDQYRDVQAGNYSGGNKRKLCVAIACIGNPPVVFLDEPSAGMDPDARKKMWQVIDDIKSRNTSLILTTHSMEEAEAVCDRIAIMVSGRFRCLGTSTQIKNKFGKHLELYLKVSPPNEEQLAQKCSQIVGCMSGEYIYANNVETALDILGNRHLYDEISKYGSGAALHTQLQAEKKILPASLVEWFLITAAGDAIFDFLKEIDPNAKLVEQYFTFYKFQMQKNESTSIGYLFGLIEDNKEKLEISEYSLSQTTLEQIFNMFAQVYDESRNAYLARRASTKGGEGLPGLPDPSVLEGYQKEASPDPVNNETSYQRIAPDDSNRLPPEEKNLNEERE